MVISFQKNINGKPTTLPEKVMIGLYKNELISISKMCELFRDYPLPVDYRLRFIDTAKKLAKKINPKLHTIRAYRKTKSGEISPNQWKAGHDIHFAINNRSPNYFQFAPVIKCVSVQTIEIKYAEHYDEFPMVFIDDRPIHDDCQAEDILKQLAVNDGFDDLDGFFNYFDGNFTGLIVHWSNLKY